MSDVFQSSSPSRSHSASRVCSSEGSKLRTWTSAGCPLYRGTSSTFSASTASTGSSSATRTVRPSLLHPLPRTLPLFSPPARARAPTAGLCPASRLAQSLRHSRRLVARHGLAVRGRGRCEPAGGAAAGLRQALQGGAGQPRVLRGPARVGRRGRGRARPAEVRAAAGARGGLQVAVGGAAGRGLGTTGKTRYITYTRLSMTSAPWFTFIITIGTTSTLEQRQQQQHDVRGVVGKVAQMRYGLLQSRCLCAFRSGARPSRALMRTHSRIRRDKIQELTCVSC